MEGRSGRERRRGKEREGKEGRERGKEGGGTGPPPTPIKSWLRACVDVTTAFRVHYDILPVKTVIDIHSIIVIICTLSLHQCWNRIFGSTILVGSGQCDRPGV